jgi:hypothetical protein
MKALAVIVDGIPYCCRCAEDLSKKSEYPHLFFSLVDGITRNSDDKCPRCGGGYGGHDAQVSARRICAMMAGENA